MTQNARDKELIWQRLQQSAFRRRFSLDPRDSEYLHAKGMSVILNHARDFITRRLAPAFPAKEKGKQTPWRGHPVFVAQHATATCCRGCLEKWYGIPRGVALSEAEQAFILSMIALWLERRGSGGQT